MSDASERIFISYSTKDGKDEALSPQGMEIGMLSRGHRRDDAEAGEGDGSRARQTSANLPLGVNHG